MSRIKYWWKCAEGHEWEANIDNRKNGTGCPVCSGKKTVLETSLLGLHPELVAQQWDYGKNTYGPETVTPKSQKEVFWKCPEGHCWEQLISARVVGSRVRRNTSRKGEIRCPKCEPNQILTGGAYSDENILRALLAHVSARGYCPPAKTSSLDATEFFGHSASWGGAYTAYRDRNEGASYLCLLDPTFPSYSQDELVRACKKFKEKNGRYPQTKDGRADDYFDRIIPPRSKERLRKSTVNWKGVEKSLVKLTDKTISGFFATDVTLDRIKLISAVTTLLADFPGTMLSDYKHTSSLVYTGVDLKWVSVLSRLKMGRVEGCPVGTKISDLVPHLVYKGSRKSEAYL